jgi:hypothetical protein
MSAAREESPVMGEEVRLKVHARFQWIGEEEDGKEVGHRRGEQDEEEEEEEERPVLLGAPAIEDPPVKDEVEEDVERPDKMNRAETHSAPKLQELPHPGEDPGDA